MILLRSLSVATLFTLAVGCRSSGYSQMDSHASWARHEGISRTYTSGVCSLEVDHGSALANDDTSRTYESSPEFIADDMLLRGYNDDTSRTYHSSGAMTINEHGTYVGEVMTQHEISEDLRMHAEYDSPAPKQAPR